MAAAAHQPRQLPYCVCKISWGRSCGRGEQQWSGGRCESAGTVGQMQGGSSGLLRPTSYSTKKPIEPMATPHRAACGASGVRGGDSRRELKTVRARERSLNAGMRRGTAQPPLRGCVGPIVHAMCACQEMLRCLNPSAVSGGCSSFHSNQRATCGGGLAYGVRTTRDGWRTGAASLMMGLSVDIRRHWGLLGPTSCRSA